MMENQTKEEGYLIIPKSWLQAIAEKQDKIISLLEKVGGYDATNCLGDYISEDEAKRQLGRKATWCWQMRTSGQLPFTKVGKKIFYLKSDIKCLLEKNMKGTSLEYPPILSNAA